MNDSFHRLLIESGLLHWTPRRGFPFDVDMHAVRSARHLERIAHFFAKSIRQDKGNVRGVALAPHHARDERLVTAVAMSLWSEFHIDSYTLNPDRPATLEANLYVLTDLYPRPGSFGLDSVSEASPLTLLSALTWTVEGAPPEKQLRPLTDLSKALDSAVRQGLWAEEARAHWNRYLFHQSLRDEDSPQAGQ